MNITEKTSNKRRRAMDTEIRVHAALTHQNIVRFYQAYRVDPETEWKSRGCLPGIYLLMEYAAGGTLFDRIGKWISCAFPDLCVADPS